MRTVDLAEVTAKIREMAIESNYNVDPAYVARLEEAKATESSPLGLRVLNQLTENAALAAAERVPYCQDTGVSVVFVELGQDVHLSGGSLEDAINEGIRQGYRDGYRDRGGAEAILERSAGFAAVEVLRRTLGAARLPFLLEEAPALAALRRAVTVLQ